MTLMAAFISLGVAFGYALMHIPNVELVTAIIFISGFILGFREGLLIGWITEFVFSIFHPMGAPLPPLLIAQVLSMGLTGAIGGIVGKAVKIIDIKATVQIGIAGFVSTLIFDILTTLSFLVTVSSTWKQITTGFLAGIIFYAIHLINNTVIFIVLVPLVLRAALKNRYRSMGI